VLGTTFPAEALIALFAQEEAVVQAALADLMRREVFSVSADPLSPERGSYRFSQQMLRQVAYHTLTRRDRKARHLKVAEHLRHPLPRRRQGSHRRHRPALPGRAGGRARRPRQRPDPRAGHHRADPRRRTRRAHRIPGPRCRRPHRGRRAMPDRPGGRDGGRPSAGVLWGRAGLDR